MPCSGGLHARLHHTTATARAHPRAPRLGLTSRTAQALLSFGIEHPTVPMTPGRKTMKKAKFQQNVAMELNNRALSGS